MFLCDGLGVLLWVVLCFCSMVFNYVISQVLGFRLRIGRAAWLLFL